MPLEVDVGSYPSFPRWASSNFPISEHTLFEALSCLTSALVERKEFNCLPCAPVQEQAQLPSKR